MRQWFKRFLFPEAALRHEVSLLNSKEAKLMVVEHLLNTGSSMVTGGLAAGLTGFIALVVTVKLAATATPTRDVVNYLTYAIGAMTVIVVTSGQSFSNAALRVLRDIDS